MHQRNPSLLLAMLAAMGLAACSTPQVRETAVVSTENAPVRTEPAQESDAYDTIEQASISALANDDDAESESETVSDPEPQAPSSIWERFSNNVELPSCTPGSDAHDWAKWYGKRQEYMDRVLTRAEPWLFDIMQQLDERDLPIDLALLPVVESAFDPFASSAGRAVGTWQFVRGTAKDFGLTVNDWYDGRRDVYAATRAALDYFRFLFDKFDNDWELALAAYNGGQNRLDRALKRYRGSSPNPRPKDLRLPKETRSYAPKLHGLSCLVRAPQDFGLTLPAMNNKARVAAVEFDGPLDLIVASRLAELDIAELFALNPGFSRWATSPKGPHRVILPAGREEIFREAYAVLPESDRIRWQGVVVKSGDTLSTIAARAGISVNELMAANQLKSTTIRPGQELRILGNTRSTADFFMEPDYKKQLAALQKLQGRLLPGEVLEHRVRNGENLWVIARKYKVTVKDLARWNGISNTRSIHPGQRLRVGSKPNTSNSAAVTASTKPSTHRVQRGDSPWTIARRYRIKLDDLLRWNQLNSSSVLQPGQTLRVSASGNPSG